MIESPGVRTSGTPPNRAYVALVVHLVPESADYIFFILSPGGGGEVPPDTAVLAISFPRARLFFGD